MAKRPWCRTLACSAGTEQSASPRVFRWHSKYAQSAPSAQSERSALTETRRALPYCCVPPAIDFFFRTTTVLADGRTLCLAPAPKGAKEKLDQGRLRESRKELEVTFDRVLGEGAEQKEVYDQVKACVRLPFSGELAFEMTADGLALPLQGLLDGLVSFDFVAVMHSVSMVTRYCRCCE